MKNSKVKGLLGLLVLLFAVGLFGFFGYDTMDDIKLGLDLAGGVSITYQAVDENPTSEEMSDRKSTRLNSSHIPLSRMPSSA